MHETARMLVSLALTSIVGCGGGTSPEPARAETTSGAEAPASTNGNGAAGASALARASTLIDGGRCADAMRNELEPAIATFERSAPAGTRMMGSRTDAGTMTALVYAMSDGTPAMVGTSEWPDLLYLEAYCLVELGRMDDARAMLEEALRMIPNDVVYACELGHVLQQSSDWPAAIELFRAGLENAEMLGRGEPYASGTLLFGRTITEWRGRALRGIGFSLIELGELDEAERAFYEAISIDPTDEQAMGELDYIRELRAH